MKKQVITVLAAALMAATPALAKNQTAQYETPEQTNAMGSTHERLQSVLKQLDQIHEDERQLSQVQSDLWRVVKVGGTAAIASGILIAGLIAAGRINGDSNFLMNWLARREVRSIFYPLSGIVAGGSIILTSTDAVSILNEIDMAQSTLAKEKSDLNELVKTSEVR